MTILDRDQLIAAATKRADTKPTPEEWGYRVALEKGETFVGRWRADTTDAENNERPIYLVWDEDGELCFSRHYAALERELNAVRPIEVGATIVIARGANYQTQYDDPGEASGFSFGVIVEPNPEPLPGGVAVTDDSIPF